MRFGFGHVPSGHYQRHVELVQRAERLGFDDAWIADQTFYRDPYVILAALATSTERIGLGLGATNPFTRHPAMTTRAIASVEEMAPGRVSIAIGAGNVKELLRPLGLDEGSSARRCRESVELMRGLLSGERIDYRGRHYQAGGVELEFPVAGEIPIYVAARGPRVLEVAGEVADGVMIGGLCGPAGIEYALDCARRGAARSGRELSELDIVSWVTCDLTDDREAAVERLRPTVAHIVGGAPDVVLEEAGLPMDVVGRIKSAYQADGSAEAGAHVTDECVDAFAIVGDAAECAERIRLLEQAGVTQFVFLMPRGGVDEHAERLEAFAGAVLSELAPAPVGGKE
jgi:5,10-methylenetetrahydromethanopterin reductase